MAETQSGELFANISFANQSTTNNGTKDTLTYVFDSVASSTKLTLCIVMLVIGLVGISGNTLILIFVSKRKKTDPIQSSSFMRNFNMYIKSLALSDLLCILISLPLLCVQFYVDALLKSWGCKVVRYLNIVFPVITIHNLIVVNIEKYLSTRPAPSTFSVSTVRKMIIFAWLSGFLVTLAPAATFTEMRYNLNETHFTVICRYDNTNLVMKVIFFSFTSTECILPNMFLAFTSICLMKTVWKRRKVSPACKANNPLKAKMKSDKMRVICTLLVITFAYVILYSAYMVYAIFYAIVKPNVSFETDFLIRHISGLLAIFNSATNVVIYFVQMKSFRRFLQKMFCVGGDVEPGLALRDMHRNVLQPRAVIELKQLNIEVIGSHQARTKRR